MTKVYDQVELYVSCRPQRPPQGFCVRPEKACILQACGLAPGQSVPVLKCYGDDQSEPARGIDGALIAVTAEKPTVIVDLPGNYKLDVSALTPDPCVYITEQCVDVDALPPARPCDTATYAPLSGYAENDTGACLPLYLRVSCAGEECVYLDPETKEWTMALNPIAAPKPSEDNCEKYVARFVAVDSTSGVTDAASLLQFVLDNTPGDNEYPTLGPVDLATDTVVAVTLMPRPEDGEDMVLVDGIEQGGFSFNAETDGDWSDVEATTIEIPDPCNFVASVCVKRCVDKAGNPV